MRDFIDYKSKIPMDKDFNKIIEFYLFKCPAKTIKKNDKTNEITISCASKRGIGFREKGIKKHYLEKYRKLMLKNTKTKDFYYECIKNANAIDVDSIEIKNKEFCILLYGTDRSKTDSIYYLIRNAFAHGSFMIKNNYYYFENKDKNKLKGLAKIHKNTLLKWIELYEMNIVGIFKKMNEV